MAKDEKVSAEQVVRDIRRETRRKYSAEEKILYSAKTSSR
jgi:hypothetical protein